jgi:hypothetical protein
VSASFSRGPDGSVVVRFSQTERLVLRALVTDLLALLDVEDPQGAVTDDLERSLGIGGNTELSDDPALARLFPDAYPDDSEAAAEFRRYTESDLRSGKRGHARTVLQTLERGGRRDRLTLNGAETNAWLGALNDLRLIVAARLEITDDQDDPLERFPAGDPRSEVAVWYHWLGWLQETLLESLM